MQWKCPFRRKINFLQTVYFFSKLSVLLAEIVWFMMWPNKTTPIKKTRSSSLNIFSFYLKLRSKLLPEIAQLHRSAPSNQSGRRVHVPVNKHQRVWCYQMVLSGPAVKSEGVDRSHTPGRLADRGSAGTAAAPQHTTMMQFGFMCGQNSLHRIEFWMV